MTECAEKTVTVDSSQMNGIEKNPQNCLKLTIRVRRLNNLTSNTNNSINDNKTSFNQNNDNNNISMNSNEDSLLTNHSMDSKSTVVYEVLPSSSATTSSSASECSSTVTAGAYLSDPTLIRFNRSKKKKKKKSKRKSRENSSNYSSSLDTTSAADSSPLNGAKRLRLIVGNETIRLIDIKKKLSVY